MSRSANEVGRPTVMLGAGGHAKVLIDLLRTLGAAPPIAVLDVDRSLEGTDVLGVPVIGDDGALEQFDREEVRLINGVGSVKSTARRRELYLRCLELGFRFETLVHRDASVACGVALGEGVQVLARAVVNVGAVLGEDSIVNTGAIVEHDCRTGAHVHVASGAVLGGGVTLGEGVHVGAGATLIQGVSVGAQTVVGAGAVVIRDLPAGVVAVGVPARIASQVKGNTRP